MDKLIRLEIQGEFNRGFSITANIEEDSPLLSTSDNRLIAGITGKLADNLQLLERYRNWQAIYQNITTSFSTFPLQRRPSLTNVSANIQDNDFEPFKKQTNDLINSFNAWLKDEAFLAIESLLRNHLNPNEENRILLLTDNPWLRKLPWQEWDLLREFPKTEIGFASPNFKQVRQLSSTSKDGVNILAIFGYQADVESQGQAIQNLEKNVEVTWLKQPKREDLDEPLWKQRWDIIFFVGHGESQDEWKTGTIWINETDKITISELRNHFKKAIENGLKLAILNCCDGLGLAHSLAEGEDLYLPQMIVMREELPVAVAPRFLQYFLEEFTQYNSLYASVREARRRLQILEKEFPCASNLPVICQNPAVKPLRWNDLVIPACPYRGLSAFQEEDAELFFGRESFTNHLVKVVEDKKLVAVIGASGSGKSSVVLAGLIPRLRQKENWLIASLRPGATPFENLAKALLLPEQLATELLEGIRHLPDVIKTIAESRTVLLVVDQFEEIYSYPNQKFLDCLLEAVRDVSAFRLVITLRADFLGQAIEYNPLREQLQRWKSEFIDAMERQQLQAVIEAPAKKRGVYLEAGLTEQILNDVGNEPGYLPLLEFALTEMWDKQENSWLTRKAYDDIGGVKNALRRHAERVYDELKKADRERVKRIFLQLVSPGEGTEYIRRMATRAEVGEANWDLVIRLATARLVVSSRNETTEIETVEIVHEALIKAWPDLQKWIEEDDVFLRWKKRLQAALKEWERNENKEGYLLQVAPLGEAEGYLQQRLEDISPAERVFIQLGLGLRDRQRRRTIFGLTGFSAIALILLVGATLGWQRAEQQRQIALVRQLEAQAEAARNQTPDLLPRSLLLAVEAMRRSPSLASEQTVRYGLSLLPRLVSNKNHNSDVDRINVSPNDKYLVSVAKDGSFQVQEISTGQKILNLNSWLNINSFIPQKIANFYSYSNIYISILQKIAKLDYNLSPHTAKFSPDNKYLVLASDTNVQVYGIPSDQAVINIFANANVSREFNVLDIELIFSPDSKYLAIVSKQTVRIYDLSNGRKVVFLKFPKKIDTTIFSGDAKYLVITSDNTVQIQEVSSGRELKHWNFERGLKSIDFSPDSKYLAIAIDRTVLLYEIASISEVKRKTYEGSIESIGFSPNNKYLAVSALKFTTSSVVGEVVKIVTTVDEVVTTVEEVNTNHKVTSIATSRYSRPNNTYIDFTPDSKYIVIKNTGDWRSIRVQALSGNRKPVEISSGGLVSPGQKYLASVSSENFKQVELWSLDDGAKLDSVNLGENIDRIYFIKDDYLLITNFTSRIAQLFTVRDSYEASRVPYGDSNNLIAKTSDGEYLATGNENTTQVWHVASEPEVLTIYEKVKAIAFNPNGKELALAKNYSSYDNSVLWKVPSGIPIKNTEKIDKSWELLDVAFSPSGKYLAKAGYEYGSSREGRIQVVDLSSGKEVFHFNANCESLDSVAFSPDSKYIATAGCPGGMASVWEIPSGTEVRSVKQPEPLKSFESRKSFNAVAFSPDGKYLALASHDDSFLQLLEISSGKVMKRFLYDANVVLSEQLEKGVNDVAFSADSKYIAIGARDRTARVWEFTTGRQVISIKHEGEVKSVAFSPDGKYLATASKDKTHTARVWEILSGREVVRLKHAEDINSVTFSPEGKYIATGSDKTARIWFWQPQDLIVEACSRLARNLTWEEWQDYLPDEPYRRTCTNLPFHRSFIEVAEKKANTGDIKGAVAFLYKSLAADPDYRDNPKAEAKRLIALALAKPAEKLLFTKNDVKKALEAYKEAEKLDPSAISTRSWQELCLVGSMIGYPSTAIEACEKAVALEPKNVEFRDSRGLARALAGYKRGAIEDFQAFIKQTNNEQQKLQRQRWIDALDAGKKPYIECIIKFIIRTEYLKSLSSVDDQEKYASQIKEECKIESDEFDLTPIEMKASFLGYGCAINYSFIITPSDDIRINPRLCNGLNNGKENSEEKSFN